MFILWDVINIITFGSCSLGSFSVIAVCAVDKQQ